MQQLGGVLILQTVTKVYIAITALVINLVVAVALTLLLRAVRVPAGTDATDPADYLADPRRSTSW